MTLNFDESINEYHFKLIGIDAIIIFLLLRFAFYVSFTMRIHLLNLYLDYFLAHKILSNIYL